MRKWLTMMAATILALGSAGMAVAQTYPSHPITMIVPFPAGGATDTLARFLGRATCGRSSASRSSSRTSRGAAGSIGVGRAVRSPADGYTLSDRHLDHAHADRRALRAAVRSVERSRADHPDRQRAAADRRQEEPAGERSQGADRLAQGQSRQGVGRHRRRRRAPAISPASRSRRRPARNSSSCRIAAMGRRCRIWWRARSICRSSRRRTSSRWSKAGSDQAVRHHVGRTRLPSRRTFRPRTRPDCPASSPRSGTGCGCRRTRRRTSSRKLNAAMVAGARRSRGEEALRRSRHPDHAAARSRRRRRCARSRRRRPTSWWPIIKAANIKAE